jgi:hypothetical protein
MLQAFAHLPDRRLRIDRRPEIDDESRIQLGCLLSFPFA